MKLVIGGSTGFVATEIISQALKNPAITSIVALGRREAVVSPDADSDTAQTKLKSVICEDFEVYPDSVKAELENADACIWTIAITPMKLSTVPWEETRKISRDYATTAIKTLHALNQQHQKPLRFLYMSGHFAPRSRAEVPPALQNHGLVDYGLLRGETETLILEYAAQSHGAVQSCVVKPGLIDAPGAEKREIPGLPHIDLPDIAAALLEQVVSGFEKDTLSNDDLVRIGLGSRMLDAGKWRE